MGSDILVEQQIRNRLQSALLVLAMAVLLGWLAWIVGGGALTLLALVLVLTLYFVTPLFSPSLILRLYQARPIRYREAPRLHALLEELARRAALDTPPGLFYVPSDVMNAFAVGEGRQAVIALSDGMLRRLSLEELAGVLAHELSHIRNRDLRVLGFADLLERLTRALSLLGQLLFLVSLPVFLFTDLKINWVAIAVLIFSPAVSALGQLALARTREFAADLGAAQLLGYPEPLANALVKMEHFQGRVLEHLIGPGQRLPDPSLLRTHPPTEERIARLMALRERPDYAELLPPIRLENSDHPRSLVRSHPLPPRWHIGGYW
jgi:heat shock protein HtpX